MRDLRSTRLLLKASTALSTSLERSEHQRLGQLLDCQVPPTWPPTGVRDVLDMFEETLRDHPDQVGWHGWYWIALDHPRPTLVGSGGFRGPPLDEGAVEVGYGMLDPYRGLGYATEGVSLLVDHAFRQPTVRLVFAECEQGNVASQRVLIKCGFVLTGVGSQPDLVRFARSDSRPGSRRQGPA
ncbi:MAG: GNAT family N-acetyltransferase [Lacipirellulaceae bacterium]